MLNPLTSSAEASPARTSASLGREPGSPAPALVFGPSTRDSFANYDPGTSLWKTFQLSVFGDSDEFSGTWPRSGMTRSGTAYLLPPSAPLTSATASGSSHIPEGNGLWPTPAACVPNLGESPSSWLERRERVKLTAKNGNGMGMPLSIAVQMWPTPLARDWKGPGFGDDLPAALARRGETSGALNPTWVEWLMGYPLGWTDCEHSETP